MAPGRITVEGGGAYPYQIAGCHGGPRVVRPWLADLPFVTSG
jgi:hypothetical protein